jgi:endonuclease-3
LVEGRLTMDARKLSETVRRRLEKEFGIPEVEEEDPLSALVGTILSQNTTDITSDRAWASLRRRYPTMESLKRADPEELADTIRVGGLPRLKADRILGALRDIERMTGKLSLDFLHDMTEEEADSWLSQLKGVGPKTRAIILLFALKKNAFPVDTHISRVSQRLGLVRKGASREEAQARMAALSRPEDYFSYHINLIEHGRKTCSARNPKCGLCALSDICPWGEKKNYGWKPIHKRKRA